MSYNIWRRIRRPFRYPSCRSCVWEVFDANQAGCLKCGKHHFCHNNSVDNRCRLVLCEDNSRVCDITGFVLPEVRHAESEYSDTIVFTDSAPVMLDINDQVLSIVTNILASPRAARCRVTENKKLYQKLGFYMTKQAKQFKFQKPNAMPCVHQLLAGAFCQERYWHFIEEASEHLVQQCARQITVCLLELRQRGIKLSTGTRMQFLVCGLLYMLKNGLHFNNKVLLAAIPEVARCLPQENKIETYFGISSKVICMTENEVKLVFRDFYQA